MNPAIKLLNRFVEKTQEVCDSLCVFADYKYDHSISAAVDCQHITVHKIHELTEICGFFTATAKLLSDDISFEISFGGIEFSLKYTVKVGAKEYTFTSYLKSVLNMDFNFPASIRTAERLDMHLNDFNMLILQSYPLFMSDKDTHLKEMAEMTKKEQKVEEQEEIRSQALVAIRRANIHFIEKEYCKAYEIYTKNIKYLSDSDKENMEKCKEFSKTKVK